MRDFLLKKILGAIELDIGLEREYNHGGYWLVDEKERNMLKKWMQTWKKDKNKIYK